MRSRDPSLAEPSLPTPVAALASCDSVHAAGLCNPDSNFVLGNAQATGWPIVYCSDGFCELTGYGRAQVMAKGCACKFLYGEETSDNEIKSIDDALENKKEHKTEVLLYKKNGSPIWCLMDIVPIKNEKRQVVLFLVSHKDITREKNATTPENGSTDINDNTGSMDKDDSDSSKSDDDDSDEMPDNYNYSRRRSRAVLYHISGQLNKQNKAKTKLQQLNRLGNQMPEYKVQEVKKSKLVIVHYGIFKIGWDWLILLCTFYIAIMVPFNAAFRKEGRGRDFIYVDAAVEVLFALDIVLNFRTSFVNKNGQVCYDSRLIALNYMRGWFLLDLLAAIPFDLLYAFRVDTGTLIHLLKVARLLRLARLLQKIERYSQYSVFVVAILMCMFALLAHWLACIWYAIGKQELDDSPSDGQVGWLYELSERINVPIDNDTLTSYVTALYFTCSSLTSVGFGNVSANTNAEKIFSVCAMLVGAMMHAVVFGNVTAFIQRMYARRATFHAKTKDLKEFFRFHHFPKPLKTRMQEYFQTMWSVNNGIDVRDIMKDFPEDLRGEISLHLNREILSLPIFENATQGCLRSVALQTNRVFFGPGEVLIHKGDAIRNIYYVCSGSLEVLKDEQVVAILGKGDLFGSDIKFEEPISISGCDVRSLAYCELLCINTQGLVECLHPYPEFSEKFLHEFPNDLTYNLREGHEDFQLQMVPRFERILKRDDDTLLPAINTLPAISEDEEEELSEDEKEDEEHAPPTPITKAPGDEEETETNEHSSTSPLLNKFTGRSSFPNGDIIGGLRLARNLRDSRIGRLFRSSSFGGRGSEPSKENTPALPTAPRRAAVTAGGGGGVGAGGRVGVTPSPAYLRTLSTSMSSSGRPQLPGRDSKMRPGRPLSVMSSASSNKSEDAVQVHHLQTEVEGTRTSVDKLERRLDGLCGDVKDIGTTLQHILKAMGTTPPPPLTPHTPPHHNLPGGGTAAAALRSSLCRLKSPPPDASSCQAEGGGGGGNNGGGCGSGQLSSTASASPPILEKAAIATSCSPLNQVRTYMRGDGPHQRRVVDRQRSAPLLHLQQQQQPGGGEASPRSAARGSGSGSGSGAGRPQFFFGSSPEKEVFSDIFTTACTQGTCGALPLRDFSPSPSRGFLGGGGGGGGGRRDSGCGGVRPSPTLSPLSQGSINSHTRLLGGDDSPHLGGGGGGGDNRGRDFKSQYYKFAGAGGSDDEHDLLSTNGHSSSGSPLTPLSPYNRPEPSPYPRSPNSRFNLPMFRRRGNTGGGGSSGGGGGAHPHPSHPDLLRQTSVSLPEPPRFLDTRSSGSEESLTKSESLPLEPLDVPSVVQQQQQQLMEEVRAPLSRAESFSDLIQPQDSTEL